MAVKIVADNIISPLGNSTNEVVEAIYKGKSGLQQLPKDESIKFIPSEHSIVAGIIEESAIDSLIKRFNCADISTLTRLEKLMVLSVFEASQTIDNKDYTKQLFTSEDTILLISSTKGNISQQNNSSLIDLGYKVAKYLNLSNKPLVISNACIGGVVAIIVAKRLLESGLYKRAIVIGADELSSFIVSGFDSFKALSDQLALPFDSDRKGLNLGEAVGTIILEYIDDQSLRDNDDSVQLIIGDSISNDANHITGPSRTGEGLYRAIRNSVMAIDPEEYNREGFVNPHGTATIYNDQMESVAISRCRITLPIVPLKSFLGHTLGASGVVETILSSRFMKNSYLPHLPHYHKSGTEPMPLIYPQGLKDNFTHFSKFASGFGGCNAAICVANSIYLQKTKIYRESQGKPSTKKLSIIKSIEIFNQGNSKEFLTQLYKDLQIDYPKFYKMDLLSKGAIIAMNQLLGSPESDAKLAHDSGYSDEEIENTALLFCNNSGSKACDDSYYKTIDKDNFFPSPALFAYTLPSVCVGEVSIRYKFYGEGLFFIVDNLDQYKSLIDHYIEYLFNRGITNRLIFCFNEVTEDRCDIKATLYGCD